MGAPMAARCGVVVGCIVFSGGGGQELSVERPVAFAQI